jgi:hypothetical protein
VTLFGENKDIIDVVMSSLCIDFDQTMMEIYYDFSFGGIILI